MKKILLLPLILSIFVSDANAAARAASRGNARSSGNTGASTGAKPVSARAATTAPAGAKVGSASATSGAPKTVNRGRAATAPASTGAKPVVSARAGTVQKVINTGTKVATATKNITVSEECQQKYDGCMDSFCMIENETGGRCTCSDKNAEFDAILAEIEKLDQQSYQMATFGVEKIEMGELANDVIAAAKAAAEEFTTKEEIKQNAEATKKKARRTVDLSAWNTPIDMDDEESDVFGESLVLETSPIDGKEGDELHRVAANLCAKRIPECKADLSLLQMMYSQRIKSDCSAYENSLKQQKNASAQKLQTAERALRDAALEQLENANKYDLGQCTVEFKKCMQTTAGCGNDFTNCAQMSALDNTAYGLKSSSTSKIYKIKGTATNIEISAQTYDILMGKKPLCETITKSCVAVADQVWDTFLREVGPQLKSAEIIAEDKARQDCIGNISKCFQNACASQFGEDDTSGKYDMCLSRPGTMLHVCKVPLNTCGIDASSTDKAEQSEIWNFVIARLASMRVDSCTTQVKQCLTSEDRCGEDYTKCVGLDTDTIIRMCPYQKLSGCVEVYGAQQVTSDETYDTIANMIQGIFLNIDDNFLTTCQNAIDEAMVKVCGNTDDCSGLEIDKKLGARNITSKICAGMACFTKVEMIPAILLGEGADVEPATFEAKIDGHVPWDMISFASNSVEYDEDGNILKNEKGETVYSDPTNNGFKYLAYDVNNTELTPEQKKEISDADKLIESTIAMLEADTTVMHCTTGRTVQGMTKNGDDSKRQDLKGGAHFDHLAKNAHSAIANSVLQTVRANYNAQIDKINSENNKMLADIAAKVIEIKSKEEKIAAEQQAEAQRESNRQYCLTNAGLSQDAAKADKNNTYTSHSSTNEKDNVNEITTSATYDAVANTCTVIKKRRDCKNIKCNKTNWLLCPTRRCKDNEWGDWYETYNNVINYAQ